MIFAKVFVELKLFGWLIIGIDKLFWKFYLPYFSIFSI